MMKENIVLDMRKIIKLTKNDDIFSKKIRNNAKKIINLLKNK